jgi:hypothetical protein
VIHTEPHTYDPSVPDLVVTFVCRGSVAGSYNLVCSFTGFPKKVFSGDVNIPEPHHLQTAEKPNAIQASATVVPYQPSNPGGYSVKLEQAGHPTQETETVSWDTVTIIPLTAS